MSASEPPEDPNAWNDDTSAVPVGPEPEPTGAGGSGGEGGWGQARVEPFAVAALVWAIVSIVLPLVGTIIAFVLAARAADLIRRSRGERTGMQYVTAARVIAAVVLALWIIGGIAFLALRDDGSSSHVAVPTQPPSTTVAVTTSTTLAPATTTTTKPPVTTSTLPPPTISVIPPTTPPTSPPTSPPTNPPTNPPTSIVTTTTPATTTKPPPSTTTPQQAAAKVQAKLVTNVGVSNRGVPDDQRFVVDYTPGQDLFVTWAINNGPVGEHPTGTPTCTSPPTTSPSSTTSTSSTSTSTTSTTTPTSSTSAPAGRTTQQQARYEARQMLLTIKSQIKTLHLDVSGIQLVGTYPIEGGSDEDVVQALYSKSVTVPANYLKMFDVPPAEVVQCLNPAFDLP